MPRKIRLTPTVDNGKEFAKFRRVYESLKEFRANYAIWNELARP